jgi:putative nucleotidyltransferase with HDIG domain
MYPISLKQWLSGSDIRIPRLYLVGGTVRDLLLGTVPKDADLVCREAKEFANTLAQRKNAALVPMEKKPDAPCYRVVDRDNSENFLDIAEMRGNTINDDLAQRDFTIDAIAMEVKDDGTAGAVIDPFQGTEDIKKGIIRAVSDASIASDPLRILRAVRLSAVLNFTIEKSTMEEMKNRASLLKAVSAERVMAELMLILKTPRSAHYFRQMDHLGILEVIFPETTMMKACAQNGFHHRDVWEHSLLVMEHTEHIINHLPDYFAKWSGKITALLGDGSRLPLLKLSALLHDIGKPATKGLNTDTGRITFYRHDEEGARLIELVSERMKTSSRDRDFMKLLCSEHLRPLHLASEGVKPSTKIKWFRMMGDESVPVIILSIADVMSSLGPESGAGYRERQINWSKQSVMDYYERVKAQIERPNLVTGDDLIVLGLKPGPEIGRVLEEIRNAQDTGDISSREEAIGLAKKLIDNMR